MTYTCVDHDATGQTCDLYQDMETAAVSEAKLTCGDGTWTVDARCDVTGLAGGYCFVLTNDMTRTRYYYDADVRAPGYGASTAEADCTDLAGTFQAK